MDGGAWWAAFHGVTRSWSRLSNFTFTSRNGEGNGNPLQCSCLENPRDGIAWWAAVYGVIQSRTRLKRLSSSSSSRFTSGEALLLLFWLPESLISSVVINIVLWVRVFAIQSEYRYF